VFTVGSLLTLVATFLTHKDINVAAQADFQRLSDRAIVEISARFQKSLYGLYGARGLYAASKSVSRTDFQAYVDSRDMPKEFPGVRGFGFIRHIQRSQLPAFLKSTRKDGAPEFSVRQLEDKSQDNLFVIEFIEPLNRNKTARGLDIGSESSRRAAAVSAIDTGEATITGSITLVQDERRTPGVLLFVPVYAQGSRPDSPDARRTALRGLLYAPIIMDELLAEMPDVKTGQLDFELYDSEIGTPLGTLMLDADDHIAKNAALGESSSAGRKFSLQRPLVIAGRNLTLSMNSTSQFDATIDHSKVLLVLLGGEVLSVLLAFILFQQVTARQNAQLLADSITSELDNLAQVVKHTANSVTICDTSGRITWVNDGFTEITGYTFQEALGKTAAELIASPNTDPNAVNAIQSAVIAGQMCRVEILNRKKSGAQYWIDTEIQPQFNADGALKGFLEIGTDVTAKRKALAQLEAAMRESSALLGALDMHAIISMADRDGNITEVNDAFCKISGYSRDHLLGKNHRIVKSIAQNHEFWSQMWQDISSGKSWRGQICNRAKDGSLYWVDTFIAPFIGDDGRVEKYISIRIDITDAKEVERSLALERQRLNVILDSLGEGVYTLDPEGKCNYLNVEAETLLGWSFEELQGRSIHDIIHHHKPGGDVLPSLECPIYLAMHNERIYRSNEEMFFRKDGTGFPVSMTGSPLVFEGKKLGSVAVFTDITEAKLLQKNLETAKSAAEDASKSKSQFLANMSHEIRTPMNAILGMLQLLGATELNARQTDYADKAESAAKSLLGLLNDILDFSKIEAGKMELDPQPFSVEQLLRDLSVIVSSNLGQKPVEVLFDLDPTLPMQLVGDSMRLQQVLINLSGNAIKFN
jgi:PAS domain S-box-containing protein